MPIRELKKTASLYTLIDSLQEQLLNLGSVLLPQVWNFELFTAPNSVEADMDFDSFTSPDTQQFSGDLGTFTTPTTP
jgi:hypothetical protein